MDWTIEHEDQGVVVVRTKGALTPDMNIEILDALRSVIAEHGFRRVLIDHRALATASVTMMDIYALPKLYEEFSVSRLTKAAVVFPKITEKLQFYEDVCRNRGYDFRIFTDYEAAKAWLVVS